MAGKQVICAALIGLLLLPLLPSSFTSAWAQDSQRNWTGVCVHQYLATPAVAIINNSGVGWVRIDAADSATTDFQRLKTQNQKILAVLDAEMFHSSPTVNFTLEAWQNSVQYYASTFPYVDAWEIWNEPSSTQYPLLGLNVSEPENLNIMADFYFSMVQTASHIIRQYNPSATIVLFGGLTLYSGEDPCLEIDKSFATLLAPRNITDYGDAISVHAYPWGVNQPCVWGNYSESLTFYKNLFQAKDGLQYWLTETGQKTDVEGEVGQAKYMTDALDFFQGKVDRFFWYSLIDYAPGYGRFGLVGKLPECIPRPALEVLQDFIGVPRPTPSPSPILEPESTPTVSVSPTNTSNSTRTEVLFSEEKIVAIIAVVIAAASSVFTLGALVYLKKMKTKAG